MFFKKLMILLSRELGKLKLKEKSMKLHINEELTARELIILKLVTTGTGNSEIGNIIHISIHTVKAHISSIIRKLNAKNRTNAAYLAAVYHLVDE